MLLLTYPESASKKDCPVTFYSATLMLIEGVLAGVLVCYGEFWVATMHNGELCKFSHTNERDGQDIYDFKRLQSFAEVITLLQSAQASGGSLKDYSDEFSRLARPRRIPEPPTGRPNRFEAAAYAVSWLVGRRVSPATTNHAGFLQAIQDELS